MPSHCLNLSLSISRLQEAQREFFFAWKALEADKTRNRDLLLAAKSAQRLLEDIHRLITEEQYRFFNPLILESFPLKKNYHEIHRLIGHTGTVAVAHLLPDGRILSAGADHTIRLWTLNSDTQT